MAISIKNMINEKFFLPISFLYLLHDVSQKSSPGIY